MTYRIFGDLRSGAFSAEAALAEAGAPYEFQIVSLDRNEQREPAFLAVNPSGKVPALTQLAQNRVELPSQFVAPGVLNQ
jgi:glutathione S-transferase